MKNLISKTKIVLMALSIIMFISCNAEDGAIGPPGAAGVNGINGLDGQDGLDGNANVTQFDFPAFTHNGSEQNREFDLSETDFEKSLLFVYVKTTANFWYPLPGLVTGSYEYRVYYSHNDPNVTRMMINRITGAGDQDFSNLRILVIPASTFKRKSSINWSNYEEVASHFGLDY